MNSNEPSACKFEEISLYGVVLELMHKLRHCQSHLFVNTTHFFNWNSKELPRWVRLSLGSKWLQATGKKIKYRTF